MYVRKNMMKELITVKDNVIISVQDNILLNLTDADLVVTHRICKWICSISITPVAARINLRDYR